MQALNPFAALVTVLAVSGPTAPLQPADVLDAGPFRDGFAVSVSLSAPARPGTRLLLVDGIRPVGWLDLIEEGAGQARFRSRQPLSLQSAAAVRAWLLQPDAVASFFARWPVGAELLATVDTVGAGCTRAWIAAGTDSGVETGDRWLQLLGGQPVASFEVLSREPRVSFCSVVRLADGWLPKPGHRVRLWPSPAQRRYGQASTAVAFVESAGPGAFIVWVAAPRYAECPREAHLDFWRNGRWLGHAIVEGRDELFWYARFIPPQVVSEVPAAASEGAAPPAGQATTGPAVSASEDDWQVRVGDVAVVRTKADIQARRFVAHVFGDSAGRALVDAGEVDGLKPGDRGTLLRQGQSAGMIELVRVQTSYSVAQPVDGGVEPWPGDEVLFGGARPTEGIPVARISEITGPTLFVAQALSGREAPLLVPLAVRSEQQVVGVAVLVAAGGRELGGVALEESLVRGLSPGDLLTWESGLDGGADVEAKKQ